MVSALEVKAGCRSIVTSTDAIKKRPIVKQYFDSYSAYLKQNAFDDSFSYVKRSHAISAERSLVNAMQNDFLENMVQYMPQNSN